MIRWTDDDDPIESWRRTQRIRLAQRDHRTRLVDDIYAGISLFAILWALLILGMY